MAAPEKTDDPGDLTRVRPSWGAPVTTGHRFSAEVRVRLSETDALGIAFHGHFFTWMDVARIDYLRNLGLMGDLHPTKDFTSVMVHAACDFKSPARFDDPLVIHTRISEIGRTSITFECEIVHKRENRLIGHGTSTLVAVDPTNWRPIPVPENFRTAVRAFEGPTLIERPPVPPPAAAGGRAGKP